MATVNCPHCGKEHEVMLPERDELTILCGRCRRYFTVKPDGSVK